MRETNYQRDIKQENPCTMMYRYSRINKIGMIASFKVIHISGRCWRWSSHGNISTVLMDIAKYIRLNCLRRNQNKNISDVVGAVQVEKFNIFWVYFNFNLTFCYVISFELCCILYKLYTINYIQLHIKKCVVSNSDLKKKVVTKKKMTSNLVVCHELVYFSTTTKSIKLKKKFDGFQSFSEKFPISFLWNLFAKNYYKEKDPKKWIFEYELSYAGKRKSRSWPDLAMEKLKLIESSPKAWHKIDNLLTRSLLKYYCSTSCKNHNKWLRVTANTKTQRLLNSRKSKFNPIYSVQFIQTNQKDESIR